MISNEFKGYVSQRNIPMIRKELLAIFNANPDLGDGSFLESLRYAQRELNPSELFDGFSNEFEIQKDKNSWDSSYVAKIFLQLRKEFSKELVDHLMEVAPVVYHEKAVQRDRTKQVPVEVREQQKEASQSNSHPGICQKAVIVAVAVLVVIVVIGLCLMIL